MTVAELLQRKQTLELAVIAGVKDWKDKRWTVVEKDAGDNLARAFDAFWDALVELDEAISFGLAELTKPEVRR